MHAVAHKNKHATLSYNRLNYSGLPVEVQQAMAPYIGDSAYWNPQQANLLSYMTPMAALELGTLPRCGRVSC